MIPLPCPIPITPSQSFAVKHLRGNDCEIPYHVHDAHELILVRSGSGSFYVGNGIRRFQAGDVFLLAPGVPHWFRCEQLNSRRPEAYEFIVLQFYKSFLGDAYFDLPEHGKLKRLFVSEGLAVSFKGFVKDSLAEFLLSLPLALPQRRLVFVLRILALLGELHDFTPMQQAISTDIGLNGSEPLAVIRAYVAKHLRERIYLEQAAGLVNMSVPTFCRYFRRHTGATFMDFVHEVRIEHACALLEGTPLALKRICQDCGFQSMAHFIRLFKRKKGMTPKSFRERFGRF